MNPEFKELVAECASLVNQMREKDKAMEARDAKLYKRLGIDADKEEKYNLSQMAETVADLELKIQKLGRARALGSTEVGETGEILGKGMPFFDDPREEASWLVRSSRDYRRAMNQALRKGGDGFRALRQDALDILTFKSIPASLEERIAPEVKAALATDFDPGAGFLAPPTMETAIDRYVLESSPLGELARVITIGGSSYEGLIRTLNRDTIAQRGEREARTSSTQLNRYEKRRIEVYESEAAPALTQTMLEDSAIDLVAELQSDASEDFAIDEGAKFINGTGVNQVEGLMTSSELKQFASGSAATFTMDALKRLPQELKVAYKQRGVYLLSRSALTTVLVMREDSGAGAGTGGYLWQPSTQDGTPSRLNGYGWRECIDLDAVAANAWPVVFGDFQQAYRIVRRRGIRILRDELTDKPNVIFFMSKRYGGRVWKGEAAVKMKCATAL